MINRIIPFLILFQVLISVRSYPQVEDSEMIPILDVMYGCPYNYNDNAELFKINKVSSVKLKYDECTVITKINRDGMKELTEGLRYKLEYTYNNDKRLSETVMYAVKDGARFARILYTYGSPTSDYEAIYLIKSLNEFDQKVVYFCNNEGRILRLSLTVQGKESLKCIFNYNGSYISDILLTEVAPDFYEILSFKVNYEYNTNGLINCETITPSGGKEYKVNYEYEYYE